MSNRQTGITAISFLLVAALSVGILLAVLSLAEIRRAIEKRLDVETVNALKVGDFEIGKSKTGGFNVRAVHEGRAEYVGNLSLVVSFDRSVEIRR
jgi:hypothetical protein